MYSTPNTSARPKGSSTFQLEKCRGCRRCGCHVRLGSRNPGLHGQPISFSSASGSVSLLLAKPARLRYIEGTYQTGTMKSYGANKAMSKPIHVLAGTGAQGRAVVNSFLALDGTPSRYVLREQARVQSASGFQGRSPGVSALIRGSDVYIQVTKAIYHPWLQRSMAPMALEPTSMVLPSAINARFTLACASLSSQSRQISAPLLSTSLDFNLKLNPGDPSYFTLEY